MTDTVFRSEGEITKEATQSDKPMGNGDASPRIDNIEPPFTDYESVHKHPFTVDHFELGRFWDTDNVYSNEVSTIEGYLRYLIDKGELANSLEAIKTKMKAIERTAGASTTDSMSVKVGKVAAYAKFLTEVDNIKHSSRKYGST